MIDPRQISFDVEYDILLEHPNIYFPPPPKKIRGKVMEITIVQDREECCIILSSAYGVYTFFYGEILEIKKIKKKEDKKK